MVRPILRVITGSASQADQRIRAGAADADLVDGVARGEAAAIRALTQRCLPRVTGVALRLLRDRAEAEDVAQETFVKVWRHINRYDPERARLETWVTRIAMNACYDRLRKKRETLLGEDTPERTDGAPSAEAQLTAADSASRVRAAVDQLPERQKLALELCHFQERTNIEAAEIMQVSVEAIESLLSRARRSLKKALAAEREALLADAAQLHGSGEES